MNNILGQNKSTNHEIISLRMKRYQMDSLKRLR